MIALTFQVTENLPEQLISREYVLARGLDVLALIRQRVQQRGHNVQDRAMAAYAPMTVEQRKQRGRQVAIRDLTMTGRLMSDIHILNLSVSQQVSYLTMGFATGRGRMLALKHQSRDPWFGISPKDRAVALQLVQRTIGTEIQKHLNNP